MVWVQSLARELPHVEGMAQNKLRRYKGESFHLILVICAKVFMFPRGMPDLDLTAKGCVLS